MARGADRLQRAINQVAVVVASVPPAGLAGGDEAGGPLGCCDFQPLIDALTRSTRSLDQARLRTAAAILLLRVALHPRVSPPLFMACARAFGVTQLARKRDVCRRLRLALCEVRRATSAVRPRDRRLCALMRRICQAGPHAREMREATLARECGVDAAHLGRCLRAETGLGFREWCRAIALRLALPLLVDTMDPLKCIAEDSGFRATGTKQLARAFTHAFRLGPREFRRVIAHLRTDPLWARVLERDARNVPLSQVLSPQFP